MAARRSSAGIGRRARQGGQATVEFAVVMGGVVIPLTFALIYTAQLLWVWHSVSDFSREGARYATTHCWQGSGDNVSSYMRSHVPLMIDQDQFRSGGVDITVSYYSKDPDTGVLTAFQCDGECSVDCVPEVVTVKVSNYQFRGFVQFLGLPAVQMPEFQTSARIESAGCDPEQGTCLP